MSVKYLLCTDYCIRRLRCAKIEMKKKRKKERKKRVASFETIKKEAYSSESESVLAQTLPACAGQALQNKGLLFTSELLAIS